jgi:hypothetical protein
MFTAIAVADIARRQAEVCCNPWPIRRVRAPWSTIAGPRHPRSVVPLRHRGGPFEGLGEVLLSLALANSYNISFFLTETHTPSRA